MVNRFYSGNRLGNVLRLADWPRDEKDGFWDDDSPAPVRRLSKEEIAQYAKQLAKRDAEKGGGRS